MRPVFLVLPGFFAFHDHTSSKLTVDLQSTASPDYKSGRSNLSFTITPHPGSLDLQSTAPPDYKSGRSNLSFTITPRR
jgi:hypothetical protein